MDIIELYRKKREKKIAETIRKAEKVFATKLIVAPAGTPILHKASEDRLHSTEAIALGLYYPVATCPAAKVKTQTTPAMRIWDEDYAVEKTQFSLAPMLTEKLLTKLTQKQKLNLTEENMIDERTANVAETYSFGLVLSGQNKILTEKFTAQDVSKGLAEDILESWLGNSAIERKAKSVLSVTAARESLLNLLKDVTIEKGDSLTREEICVIKNFVMTEEICKMYLSHIKKVDAYEIMHADGLGFPLILSNEGGALRRAPRESSYEVFDVKFYRIAEPKNIKDQLLSVTKEAGKTKNA